VVFLRELVPRRAIALVARLVYNEPYLAVPMRHAIDAEDPAGARIAYAWSHRGQAFRAWAAVQGEAHDPAPGSLAAFVTEHYWGYTRQPDGSTLEYRVEHPRWPVWSPRDWRLEGPLEALYGADMGRVLRAPPASVLAAPGSAVSVFPGRRLSASAGGTTAASGRQP
jgi:hypothetical protein